MTITYLKKRMPEKTLSSQQEEALTAIGTSLLYLEGIALKHNLQLSALGLRYAQYMGGAQRDSNGEMPKISQGAEDCFEKLKKEITLSDAF